MHASVEVVTHLWSIPNKSDIPGMAHKGTTTDTRFGSQNKPSPRAPLHRSIRGGSLRQNGTGHSNPSGRPFQPRGASLNPYTWQDDRTPQYKHPLRHQDPSYQVPIHAGQQRADQTHAEKLRAERLRREEEDRQYAQQMQYEEMLTQETQAKRLHNEDNYGKIYYSKGTFNTPAVAGFPPNYNGDPAPPRVIVTEASPLPQNLRAHVDGRSSAPILGSSQATAPQDSIVLRSWGQLTGRSASGGVDNRIFGELPGTVRDFSPSGQLGRRFFERK